MSDSLGEVGRYYSQNLICQYSIWFNCHEDIHRQLRILIYSLYLNEFRLLIAHPG